MMRILPDELEAAAACPVSAYRQCVFTGKFDAKANPLKPAGEAQAVRPTIMSHVGVDERLDQDYLVIPEVKFGAAGVCSDRLACAAEVVPNQKSCAFFRKTLPSPTFRDAHLRHSHGLAADGVGGRLKSDYMLFHRPCLQHLSAAAREFRLVETGAARASRARCPQLPIRAQRWPTSTIPI